MASVGLMHNHSEMMIMPDSAADASGVRMHAYKTNKTDSEYRIYKFINVPVLQIISF